MHQLKIGFRAIQAIAALLMSFQMLVFIPHMIWPENFVPTDALQPFALAWTLVSFCAVLVVILPAGLTEFRSALNEKRYKTVCKAGSFLLLGPVLFGLLMGPLFIAGPINYYLHRLSSSALLKFSTYKVQYADDFGPRSCGNRAVLVGDRFLWPRRIFHLSHSHMEVLRKGGSLKVVGTESRYGMLVREPIAIEAP